MCTCTKYSYQLTIMMIKLPIYSCISTYHYEIQGYNYLCTIHAMVCVEEQEHLYLHIDDKECATYISASQSTYKRTF